MQSERVAKKYELTKRMQAIEGEQAPRHIEASMLTCSFNESASFTNSKYNAGGIVKRERLG